MTMLAVFQLLAELLAAAPGVESTVDEAVTALHAGGTNSAKTAAVVSAAQSILTTGQALIASTVSAAAPAAAAAPKTA
jgi:hypothetical protein